jgi:NDP-sugar pyrophosphorylase family protein
MDMTISQVSKTVQAIILAGGRGERLRPITDTIPKSMVNINNKPFLEYQLIQLRDNGINKIVLCVGYLWEVIRDHFGDGSKFGINIEYSVEERFLGTGGALKLAEQYLEPSFFIINGDTYLPIEYSQLESLFWSGKNNNEAIMGAISVYDNHNKIVNNNVTIDPQNYILKYDKVNETEELNGVEAGVSIFDRKILEYLTTTPTSDAQHSLEIEVFPKLITNRQLLGFRTDKQFYDMGTPERLKVISEVLK